MTNWKEYTITEVGDIRTIWLCFYLDDYVNYKSNGSERWEREKLIFCKNTYPFSTYRAGDVIEIDLDKTQHKWSGDHNDDTSIIRVVRVASSSTNIITTRGSSSDIVVSPSAVNYMKSQEARELAREMSRMVDDTGKEVEYKIQVENKDGKKISHSLILRKS